MVATIVTIAVGIVVLIIGAIFLMSAIPSRYDSVTTKARVDKSRLASGVVGVIGGILLIILSFGWRQVDPGSVGVLLQFGQVQGTLNPGLHYFPPIIYDVEGMNTRVQAYDFGGDPGKDPGSGIEAFTKENQQAHMFGVVNYHIDPEYADTIYQQVGLDYFEKVIKHQADSEIKRDARAYTTDDITAHRDELANAALERLQTDVEPFHIIIDGVFISQIALPETYLDAVNQKLIAAQNIEKERNNAEAQKQAGIATANRTREEANGQADANRTITQSLSDELIRWQAIQKLNPNVNVMLVPSDNGLLLNLPLPSAAP